MLEIKITGETPLEALASLTAFGIHCMTDETVAAAANRILEAELAKEAQAAQVSKSDTATPTLTTGTAAAAAELSDAAGKAATPTNPQSPADFPPEPKPEDQPKPPKLEEVRAKGLEAAKKHGQPAVKAILESFGVSNMTSLAESDRAAFLEKLAELERPGDGNA